MSNIELSENFIVTTMADWQGLVEKGLRGADFDSLIKRADDGFVRGPLSTATDLPQNFEAITKTGAPLLDGRPWHITAPARDPDIAFANKQILEDLHGGASAIRINLGENHIMAKNSHDIKRLMDQVHTDLIPIILAPNNNSQYAQHFKDYKDAALYLGLAPKVDGLTALAENIPDTWRLITINAARVHDTGGTYAQELAYFAASAVHAYRRLGRAAAKHIGVELTTDQDGHMSIAKLRAARRIYARIAESFDVNDAALSVHVISSNRMMQSLDPWTNMLRTMSAGFGAIIGGADFITLRPFTDAHDTKQPRGATPFGHRIARNMQLMMMEESRLGQVQDAAYGSYFHEAMSEQLARTAWAEFQQIERDGGIENIAPFKARIKAAAQSREDKNAPILGVTLHPLETDNSAYREAKVRHHNIGGPKT